MQQGTTVPGFYAATRHQFTTGSIGHVQQSRKGLGVMIAIVVAAVLLICACGLGGALLGS